MSTKINREKELAVSAEAFYKAIVDFPSYPKFLPEVVSASILSGSTASVKRVAFELEVVKRFQYTLEFQLKPPTLVSWKLVESNFFQTNSGKWELTPMGSKKTKVFYELEVGFGFLVPGWITKRLTEVSLPKMFENYENHAHSIA